ncbi:unnamed protein product [Orchesella dallaii]|uniref:Uncharacterized protein n=1 Tax=Orchesella dallaii TaxID=48710 RepID=A0ABP1S1X0_9HEXA
MTIMPSISDWKLEEKEGLIGAITAGRSQNFMLPSQSQVRQIVFDYGDSEESDWEFDVYLAPNIKENIGHESENVVDNERVCTPNNNGMVEERSEGEGRVFNTQEVSTNDDDETMSLISNIDIQIENEYVSENVYKDSLDTNPNDDCNSIENNSMNDSGLCDAIFEAAHNDNVNLSRDVSDENQSVCVAVENNNASVNPFDNVNRIVEETLNAEETTQVNVLPRRKNRFDKSVNLTWLAAMTLRVIGER